MKTYSKLFSIPRGNASDNVVKGCAVLEGGAFRGVYGEGVLDAFMEQNINLECTIGVSAGALNGLNYVSGDIGRAARINLGYRHYDKYVGIRAYPRNKGLIGFDFLFDNPNEPEPFNEERLMNPVRRFVAVATNCKTGRADYFEKGVCSNLYKAVQASASMPYVSKMVDVDGVPHLDGGCSKMIAYEWALAQGYEKIIVIRTRHKSFRKPDKRRKTAKLIYQKYPAFAQALSVSNLEYNRECDEIERLEKEGRIFVIGPSENTQVARLEKDMEKLGAWYYLGYNDAYRQLDSLKAYLGIS